MKLSKKGKDRLYGSHNVFYDDDIEGDVVALYELSEVWEFEPEDFTGAVVLTAEEAKAIAYKLGYLGALTTQSKTEKETLELTDMLWWRIEQAEKHNE